MRHIPVYPNARIRFWQRVKKTRKCWLWTGATNQDGYGLFHGFTKLIGVHRFSWLIHKGQIQKGLFVLHKCDVRNCVNPNHLWLGTNADNMRDAYKKGRINHLKKYFYRKREIALN